MKKNGFVFVESIVVLMVVMLSLTVLISSYSLISRKTKEKEYYDKASDKYLLYTISSLGTDENNNNYITDNTNIRLKVERDAKPESDFYCEKTKMGSFMKNCTKVLTDLNIKYIYVVENVDKELKDGYYEAGKKETLAVNRFDNGTIEYMKTLKNKKCIDEADCNKQATIIYMIGVFESSKNQFHYASIELGSSTID